MIYCGLCGRLAAVGPIGILCPCAGHDARENRVLGPIMTDAARVYTARRTAMYRYDKAYAEGRR